MNIIQAEACWTNEEMDHTFAENEEQARIIDNL